MLKFLCLFNLPENKFTCIDVMKGKEEGSFTFSSDGGEICGCSGVFLVGEERESALKSGSSSGGNPAALIYKTPLLAGGSASAGGWDTLGGHRFPSE